MVRMRVLRSREEWLEAREKTIGGSDIAVVTGLSHWKSNVDLWREMTGKADAKDLSDNDLVRYGQNAEEHIRELFALDFPEYFIGYEPNNLWVNDQLPFAHASLDFWMHEEDGTFGVGEIKTATISSGRASEQWKGKIPNYYLAQLLWNMMVTEAEFGVLVAQLKYEFDDDMYKITRHYFVDARNHEVDFLYLKDEAEKFYKGVQEGKEPALKLPELIPAGRR